MGQIGNCAGLLALAERAKWPQQVQVLSSKVQNLPCRIPPDHPSGAPSRALSARENGRHCHMEWSVVFCAFRLTIPGHVTIHGQ